MRSVRSEPLSLLIVDDDVPNVQRLRRGLSSEYHVQFAMNRDRAIELLASSEPPQALLVDMGLPGSAGVDLLQRAFEGYPTVIRLGMMAEDSKEVMLRAINDAHVQYLFIGSVEPEAVAGVLERLRRNASASPPGEAGAASGSHVDPLTGLRDFRYLCEQADREIERASRSGRPLSLCVLSVANLRAINETYGYLAGDEALRAVAGALCPPLLRAVDVAARHDRGDRFGILMPELDQAIAKERAGRIDNALAGKIVRYGNATIVLETRVSVVSFGVDAPDAVSLVAKAFSPS